jgi:replicative DNA helicase
MEESTISCVLQDGSLFGILKDICSDKDFWFAPYQNIWSAFQKLYLRSSNIDIITVQDELERNKVFESIVDFEGCFSGYDVLVYLKEKANVSTENCESYAYQVKDDSSKRKIQEVANKSLGWINQGNNASSVLTNMELELGKISAYSGANVKPIVPITDAVDVAVHATELASKQNQNYIETGIQDLDEKLGGFFPGDLITIAARTGEGKSSLAMSIALNNALYNKWRKKTGIFSLEMGNTEYVNRMISCLTGIPSLRLKMGNLFSYEYPLYQDAIKKIKDNNYIVLDDTSNLNMSTIRNKLRKMKDWGIDLVIIDQLGLISDRFPSEQEYIRIDRLTNQFKNTAREFYIPVVVIQQMNRSSEQDQHSRIETEPTAKSLSQAGEGPSDVILMITHKKELKVIKQSKLWIVKNRNGATGVVDIKFEAERTYFRNLTLDEKNMCNPDFMKDDELD